MGHPSPWGDRDKRPESPATADYPEGPDTQLLHHRKKVTGKYRPALKPGQIAVSVPDPPQMPNGTDTEGDHAIVVKSKRSPQRREAPTSEWSTITASGKWKSRALRPLQETSADLKPWL